MVIKDRGPIKVYPGSLIAELSKRQGPKRKWPLGIERRRFRGTVHLLPLSKPEKRTPLPSLLLQ